MFPAQFSLMYLDITKSKLKCIFHQLRHYLQTPRLRLELATEADQARVHPALSAILRINPPLYTVCHEECCAGISDLEMHIHCQQVEINKPHLHPVVVVVCVQKKMLCEYPFVPILGSIRVIINQCPWCEWNTWCLEWCSFWGTIIFICNHPIDIKETSFLSWVWENNSSNSLSVELVETFYSNTLSWGFHL